VIWGLHGSRIVKRGFLSYKTVRIVTVTNVSEVHTASFIRARILPPQHNSNVFLRNATNRLPGNTVS